MEVYRRSSWLLLLFVGLQLFFVTLQGVHGEVEVEVQEGPSESECRPYIEKALKQLETGDTAPDVQDDGDSKEDIPTVEITTDDSDQPTGYGENDDDNSKNDNESSEVVKQEDSDSDEKNDESNEDTTNDKDDDDDESREQVTSNESGIEEITVDQILAHEPEADVVEEADVEAVIVQKQESEKSEENLEDSVITAEAIIEKTLTKPEGNDIEDDNIVIADDANSKEDKVFVKDAKVLEAEAETASLDDSRETEENDSNEKENIVKESSESNEHEENLAATDSKILHVKGNILLDSKEDNDQEEKDDGDDTGSKDSDSKQENDSEETTTKHSQELKTKNSPPTKEDNDSSNEPESKENEDSSPVEELIEQSNEELDLRSREHIPQLLKLDEDSNPNSKIIERTGDIILRDLKKLYDNAIKPLENLYKYKDLSNRHYGDSEIFAKPLILFMGPWSGGKSSIINYLLGIENTEHALHTGAEPSPAYFNILMYGEEPEILDGTQLAADYTFSGLQKFGQGLEERLRGYKLPSKFLEKVNVVEIPGILEVRKQVSRVFPFNDACQWFIDRADIIFLVYDPSKLDVGPETEAILDQLKGREHQTRIILNKADQVKPEELMRVQGALIWNISPLMSSAQPPIMYTTSLWSIPYEDWAPVRLLQAQERAFLRDIRSAVDKRIDNKIASARRFAVRVRNHAKMVDCYLTTYYNHKSVFGNRKQISDEIINHPQDFHIYEGLSTLTNISRYDLPDPDVYRDFFRLNALYDFQQLSATCTYFRGCPINRLDIAIAYDLPELVGKHKKLIETAINEANKPPTPKS